MWSKRVDGFPAEREGVIFIVSAPSGAGKTTLVKALLKAVPDLTLSVSCTTRAPRPGEVDGKDYHFLTRERFIAMRDRGAFAEWAEVHGSLYGTPRVPLERTVRRGGDILLDIDVQGARQLRRRYRGAVSIFVLPPSWRELKLRLTRRGTDRSDEIRRRLESARRELREISRYDYFLLNRDIRESVGWLKAIVRAERLKVARVKKWAGLSARQSL
ncbi:MAG TPA: guanylate kinase [Candidatus Acidoferrales bacterium]|nr:guanylate kinase [Candidatus Acidoferrales bacterium]